MLAVVGTYMFMESLQNLKPGKRKKHRSKPKKESTYARLINSLPFQTRFERSGIVLSPIVPLFLGARSLLC